MTVTKLLTFEVMFHAEMALLLLTIPKLTIKIIGWPPSETTFYPRLLGGVLGAIALATLTTLMGWTKDGESAGIGLVGKIVIHMTMAFVLFSMLFLGPHPPTYRGKVFSGVLAGFLVLLALVEIAYI